MEGAVSVPLAAHPAPTHHTSPEVPKDPEQCLYLILPQMSRDYFPIYPPQSWVICHSKSSPCFSPLIKICKQLWYSIIQFNNQAIFIISTASLKWKIPLNWKGMFSEMISEHFQIMVDSEIWEHGFEMLWLKNIGFYSFAKNPCSKCFRYKTGQNNVT